MKALRFQINCYDEEVIAKIKKNCRIKNILQKEIITEQTLKIEERRKAKKIKEKIKEKIEKMNKNHGTNIPENTYCNNPYINTDYYIKSLNRASAWLDHAETDNRIIEYIKNTSSRNGFSSPYNKFNLWSISRIDPNHFIDGLEKIKRVGEELLFMTKLRLKITNTAINDVLTSLMYISIQKKEEHKKQKITKNTILSIVLKTIENHIMMVDDRQNIHEPKTVHEITNLIIYDILFKRRGYQSEFEIYMDLRNIKNEQINEYILNYGI